MSTLFYFLVEGDDDERFLRTLISPHIESHFTSISISFYQYSRTKKEKTISFIKSLNSMGAKFCFLTDNDQKESISQKIDEVCKQYHFTSSDFIIIVKEEIESWYLAGIDNTVAKQMKINMRKFPKNTNGFTKEQFNALIPPKYLSRINFMVELLRAYSFKKACSSNESFNYFYNKVVQNIE